MNDVNKTKLGTESYTIFSPAKRRNKTFYHYNYRHTNGRLYSCVADSLEECHHRKDVWLKENNL
jgi:hypothetical protein